MSGSLVVVATPIGNLGDLSPRSREAIESADVVACEDTRRTGRLLQLCGMTASRLVVLNDHTEERESQRLVTLMLEGAVVALVTDAGSPAIADPGERFVRAAADAGLPVLVVPGPSAVVAALSVSGLPTGRFVFEGFLPRRGSARRDRLVELAEERRTIVVFESPHRLADTLVDLADYFGAERPVAVCRELTKLHEEVWRGSLTGAAAWAAATPVRGELVVVVGGAMPGPAPDDARLRSELVIETSSGRSNRDAAAIVAARFGVSRRRVYELALSASHQG